MICKQFRFSIC